MIQITNYKINNINIIYNIDQNIKTGIYCIDNKDLNKFILDISGINKSIGIYYRSKRVFDNQEYFSNRLFIDCNKQILNTLSSPYICELLNNTYKIKCDETQFKNHINNLQIRSEGNLKIKYTFTKEGIALSNNALSLSINKYPILLNMFENIKHNEKIKYLYKEYKTKPLLVGINNLHLYKDFLDELLFISRDSFSVLNASENILVLNNIINQDLIISECNLNNLIIHKGYKNDLLIVRNNLNNNQIKLLNKFHVNIKEIDIYQIGDYI